MSFPVSNAGFMNGVAPAYSGTFIPEIWSGKLLVKFYAATVLNEIANTDYEGEISKYGDKVNIRTVPDIVINDYQAGMPLSYQVPSSANTELLIDQGKYFAFQIDDVMKKQSDLALVDEWSYDASEKMKIAIDTAVLTAIPSQAAAVNQGATAGKISGNLNFGATGAPVAMTSANILDYIVDLGQALDEQNVPETGRYLVMPAWAASLLKKSDLKDASISGDTGGSVLRNGRLGQIDRFTLYSSNNLAPVTDGGAKCYNILAGQKTALTFASQLTEMETLKNPSAFGDLIRGLNVYGFEVVKPEALCRLYAVKG